MKQVLCHIQNGVSNSLSTAIIWMYVVYHAMICDKPTKVY